MTPKDRQSDGTPAVPDKLQFRIGEVARLCGVPTYVLRFWETEFNTLRPAKSSTGQRLYRRRDVEMALRIKTLLYDEGYTIAGARQTLRAESRQEPATDAAPPDTTPETGDDAQDRLRSIRHGLAEILGILNGR